MNRVRITSNLALLSLSLAGVTLTSFAHAQTYLVGAYLFPGTATGATNNTVYQFDTNANSGALALLVNGTGKNFTSLLTTGANSFTFAGSQAATLGPNGDLGLFFATTNTPYAPSGVARTPDLIVSRDTAGALAFFTPAAGTTLNDYQYGAATVSANGLTSFNIGGNAVSVSAYSVTSTPAGTFTLNLAPTTAPATPEPGSVALLVGMGVSGGAFAIRRRRRTATK